VILLGAILLGRIKDSPLKIWQWFLLGIGLSLVTPFMLLIIVAWLMALTYRPLLQTIASRILFNTAQILLILLTLIAFGVLFFALQQGLLGSPNMQIAGMVLMQEACTGSKTVVRHHCLSLGLSLSPYLFIGY
jgi:hypothetical protein